MTDSMAHDAHAIAEAVKLGMFMDDAASRGLGMHIEAVGPGYARIAMTVRPDMLNGFKICHGGFIFTLADSAFAYACNAYNEVTVASGFDIHLMSGARLGDLLTATATELSKGGRTGVYDIVVSNQRDEQIAVFRGRSYTMKGKPLVEGLPMGKPA